MNNLLMKATPLTEEEYHTIMKTVMCAAGYVAVCLICSLVVVTICYLLDKNWKDPIAGITAFFAGIISIILFIALILVLGYSFLMSVKYEPGKAMIPKPAPITEIKEHIKVEVNRLTIDSLPENYHYQNYTLDETKAHDFKIDDFYKESNVKLIDSNNNTYEITHEQLEELKRGKNNENN